MAKKNDMVVKNNKLVSASYYLSLNEIRLLDIALADLSQYEECEKHITTIPDFVEIRAEHYAELYDVTIEQAYTALREASEQLFMRYFTYRVKSEAFPSHEEERKARWVQEIGYVKGQGLVTLSFTKGLVELAGKLKGSFSRYHLEQKAPLTSIYAHRLYEMMLQWRGSKNVPLIYYSELRDRFQIDKHEYTRVSNFKARVLDPAIEQINEFTDITVSYKQQKEGRKIVGFIFKFKFKEKVKKKEDDSNRDENTPDLFHNLTDKQISLFGAKLANDASFGSKYAKVGEDTKAFEQRIKQELTNLDNQKKWAKDLKRVGYNPVKKGG